MSIPRSDTSRNGWLSKMGLALDLGTALDYSHNAGLHEHSSCKQLYHLEAIVSEVVI